MEEIWKPITGHEGLYEVSSLGRVRSLDKEVPHRWPGYKAIRKGRILSLAKDKDGYLTTHLYDDNVATTVKVHRLVALHFLPKLPLPEVNHIDFNKANNLATNLEWMTGMQNTRHAMEAGRMANRKKNKGSPSFAAKTNPKRAKKFTAEIVEQIRKDRINGLKIREIAEKFNANLSAISRIIRRVTWA